MEHGQIVEYGTFDKSELSRVTVLETRTSDIRAYALCHHSTGFELAGSMARYNGREAWSVRFEQGCSTHGRRFATLEEARAMLDKWAPAKVAA